MRCDLIGNADCMNKQSHFIAGKKAVICLGEQIFRFSLFPCFRCLDRGSVLLSSVNKILVNESLYVCNFAVETRANSKSNISIASYTNSII